MTQVDASLVSLTPVTGEYQTASSVSQLPDGGWIAAWNGASPDDGSYVRFQRFDAAGVRVGDIVTVVTDMTSLETPVRSEVSVLADGSWVVTWTCFSVTLGDGGVEVNPDIWQQKYDSAGSTVGNTMPVNATTAGFQDYPSTTALSDGGWVVSWTNREPTLDGGYQEDIVFQKFDADGIKIGGEIILDTSTEDTIRSEAESKVVAMDNGGWLAVWKGDEISFALYDADGDRSEIFTTGAGFNYLFTGATYDAAVLEDGRILLTWTFSNGHTNGAQNFSVQQQLFNTDGSSASAVTQVSTTAMSNDSSIAYGATPAVHAASLEDGGWVNVWLAWPDGAADRVLYQQRYDSEGNTVGSEVAAATLRFGYSSDFDVSATADGGWLITFQDSRSGNSGSWDWETYQIRYSADGRAYQIDDAPEGTDATKTVLEDGSYTFSASDFTITDRDGHAFAGIIVSSLPANGTLTYNGEAVEVGQEIAASQLGDLVWTPAENANGAALASFKFRVVDDGNSSDGGDKVAFKANTFTFNVTAVNDAPVAANTEAETFADAIYIFNPLLSVIDPDGDALKLTAVTNVTGLGKVSIVQNRLVFDPGKAFDNLADGQSSDVTIKYTVSDGKGGVTTATWTLTVHSALNEHVYEGTESDDNLTGSSKDDLLLGYDGDDVLNGGTGADDLAGGDGNDTYVIDKVTDTVTEGVGNGTDTINASVTYSIASNEDVENITLTGKAALAATGNDEDNIVTGNLGANKLTAGAGDDRLIGGAGADTMTGGTGEDTYVVDSAGDKIIETAGSEIDQVEALVTYSIAKYAYVDNIILAGTGKSNATGNAIANVLVGNANVNTLNGGAGNDTLDAGCGNDILIGGLGNDTFVFETGYGKETISDFAASGASQDIIDLSGLEGFASFDELTDHITQIKTGVLIDFGDGDSILLGKQKLTNVDASDFDF